MAFKMHKQDEVSREVNLLPKQGWQTVALQKVECKNSQKGDPMMVWELAIDTGEDAGHKIMEFFSFSDAAEKFTWARLATICDAADFTWDDSAETLEALAYQFPCDGTFRFSMDVDYSYRILAYCDTREIKKIEVKEKVKTSEAPHELWLNVEEEEYEAWEGEKRANARARDEFNYALVYQPAGTASELEPAYAGDGASDFDPDNEDAFPF